MRGSLVQIFSFLQRSKLFFYGILVAIVVFSYAGISRLQLEENLNAIIPKDSNLSDVSSLMSKTKFADQLIVTLECSDSAGCVPDSLAKYATMLADSLRGDSLIASIDLKVKNEAFMQVYDFFYKNIHLYLTDADYDSIRAKIEPDRVEAIVEGSYKALLSPTGFATKKFILKDPLNLAPMALEKLKNFQLDDNFTVRNGYIFTKDLKDLLFFIQPVNPASNTKENVPLIEHLDSVVDHFMASVPHVSVQYFGGTAVGVANAQQIKSDIVITVSVAFFFLIAVFYLAFRRIKLIALLFLPIVLGTGFALSVLSFIDNHLSSIALSVGAVLIGMSIDYSLHLFTHYKNCKSMANTIRDIAEPVFMSSLTTMSAFLCLYVVDSQALNQLGLFVALTIFTVAVLILTLIPVLLAKIKVSDPVMQKKTVLDRISAYPYHNDKGLVYAVLGLSVVFYVTSGWLTFNSDFSSLNYMPEKLAKAEAKIKEISSAAYSSVYAVTTAQTLDSALFKMEQHEQMFSQCKRDGYISSMSSVADLLISTSRQQELCDKWNTFWTADLQDSVRARFVRSGTKFQFKDKAFKKFYAHIAEQPSVIEQDAFAPLHGLFLKNYIISADSAISVVAMLKVDQEKRADAFTVFKKEKGIVIFDKKQVVLDFFDSLRMDFSTLVTLSMVIIFGVLLVFLGRIELATITFIPISLSWLWTTGLMGLFGIEFNIFNIIISTFIFGLGIDYCIFLTRGLLNNYKYGARPLDPYKLSILLSALTTVGAIGVLILAKHPALQSIAYVSIFGIVSVLLIANTLLPLLFGIITKKRHGWRSRPLTIIDSLVSFFTFFIFFFGSIFLTLNIPVLYTVPLPRRTTKFCFHWLLSKTCVFIVRVNKLFRLVHIDADKLDFSKPSVIIANHQSHLDLMLVLMLHPKIIVLTNKWVWNNPFYGLVVKFADFYPAYKGIDGGTERIAKKVAQGYSVLIFPEGTRTDDGSIKRFHQGAFSLAHELGLDLQPVLIHGAYESISKRDFFLRAGHITLKFCDRIAPKPEKTSEGLSFRAQARDVKHFFVNEFSLLREQSETPDFYARWMRQLFTYRGPVLEWYFKTKLRLEKNYDWFNSVIPQDATITDIGCGYGFLAIMLKLVSEKRIVRGYDYDEDKIATASTIANGAEGLTFAVKDAIQNGVPKSDVFILNDILHYMPERQQMAVLSKCFDSLNDGGMVLVRDANADMVSRTKGTKLTEFFSTKLLGFNKTAFESLTFISGQKIVDHASAYGLTVEVVDNAKFTSNIIYLIKKKANA